MNTTWFEKGIQQGIEQGKQQVIEQGLEKGVEKGRRETLKEQLQDSFGPLSSQAEARLQALSLEQLRGLSKLVRRATSLQELGLED